jgi:hypothetical protein
MAHKPTRTEHELQALIMQQVRNRPECRNIQGVAIFRTTQLAARFPNWDCAFSLNGPGAVPPPAPEIAQILRNEFDLAEA